MTTTEKPWAERSTTEHLMVLHRMKYSEHPIEGCFTCNLIADVERLEKDSEELTSWKRVFVRYFGPEAADLLVADKAIQDAGYADIGKLQGEVERLETERDDLKAFLTDATNIAEERKRLWKQAEAQRDKAVEAVELLLKAREWHMGFAVMAKQARTLAGLTEESHAEKN